MSLSVEIDGTPIADAIPPSSVAGQSIAKDGDVGFGGFVIDDPGADITTVGHKWVTIEESDCAQPRLFTGLLTDRDVGRSTERGMIVSDDRLHDATLVDLNAVFSLRIITYAGGKRPEETMEDRLTWLLGYQALVNLVEDTGFIDWDILGLTMDAADYTGATPKAVLDDLIGRRPAITYFAFWDPTAEARALYFGADSAGIATSALSISNDLADIDPAAGVYPPNSEAKLKRTPEEVYSEVQVTYAAGTKRTYRKRGSTSEAYIARGTTIERPYTGRLTTAQAQAEAFLDKHATETDTISATILVFPEDAGLVTAGQRMDVKFTHLPGYETLTSMRVVSVNVRPANDVGNRYFLELELEKPVPTAPSGGCDSCEGDEITFVQKKATGGADYAPGTTISTTLDSAPTPGNLLVAFLFAAESRDDAIITGFAEVASYCQEIEPYVTKVFVRCVESGDSATVTADANEGAETFGNGVRLLVVEWSGARIDSGTPAALFSLDDPTPSLPSFTPAAQGTSVLLLAVMHKKPSEPNPGPATLADYSTLDDSGITGPGTRQRMTVYQRAVTASGSYSGTWGDTGDVAPETVAIHFALAGCADTEEGAVQTPTSPIEAATDPTVNDDADDGYTVGQLWVNTSTGNTFVLTDSTAGAAVWLPIPVVLDDLADVDAAAPTDGDVLTWDDGAGEWVPAAPAAGVSPASSVEDETTWGITPAVGTGNAYARDDHTHGSPANPVSGTAIAALGFVGELLISDDPSTPLVFADLLQNEAEDDLLYADL